MITIVDYGVGNLGSIRNMLKKIGTPSEITSDAARIAAAQKLILPGVGHFDHGMKQLRARGLLDALTERAMVARVPVLGICLGAQLLARGSEEGDAKGLGWVGAEVKRFDASRMAAELKVPHMGWTDVAPAKPSALLAELREPRFYFVHSYHLVCDQAEDVLATASYGYEFVAALERGNIAGVQFHPEKSHRFGMQVLENFSRR